MENFYEMLGAPQGWQCPICKRIYSPTTPMCWYCGGAVKTAAATTAGEPEVSNKIDWAHHESETIAQIMKGTYKGGADDE